LPQAGHVGRPSSSGVSLECGFFVVVVVVEEEEESFEDEDDNVVIVVVSLAEL
jgi:hypothetical protein